MVASSPAPSSPRPTSSSSSKTSVPALKMSGSSPVAPQPEQIYDRPHMIGTPRRTPAEIIDSTFAPFDQQRNVIDPFEAEARKGDEFRQNFRRMMMEIIVETQAWAAARSEFESRKASDMLEQEMDSIAATEREQGRSSSPPPSSRSCPELLRLRLAQFVTSIKNALAMLTGDGL